MKIFVITFALLIASSYANVPKPKILNPDFLTQTAWTHQTAAQGLIDEIDKAYIDVNSLISKLLGEEMLTKLDVYKSHSDDILNIYTPVHESLDVLPIDDCRVQVVGMLQSAVGSTGSRGSLCIRDYHREVKGVADEASETINELNDVYLSLSKFVYQSFAGENALINSEQIELKINDTFKALVDKLEFNPINNDAFQAKLKTVGQKFGDCLGNAESFADVLISFAREQVDVCKELHDLPRASKRGYKTYLPEFEDALNNYPEYQW